MRGLKLLILGAALVAAPAFAGPYDAWSKFRYVKVSTRDTTLGGAGVSGAVTNFPLVVRLLNTSSATGSDVLSEAGANGASLRFTNEAGDTALSYEIDTWSASSAAIWVKVPVVKGNDSTRVRMYWGKSDALASSNGPSVFDTANGYRSVWHMGNAAGLSPRPNATYFSTFTARPRSYPVITPGVSTGAIGTADTLAGGPGGTDPSAENTTSYFFIDSANATGHDTTAFMFPGGKFTVSYWVSTTAFGTNNRHFNMQASALGVANPAGAIQTIPSSTMGNLYFRWSTAPAGTNTYTTIPTGYTPTTPGTNIQNGGGLMRQDSLPLASRKGWQHVVGIIKRVQVTVDSTRDSLYKYVDGRLVLATFGATGATLRPLPEVRRPYVMLGRTFESTSDGGHSGKLDEIQFMNASMSPDWVKLAYATQRPDAIVTTLGATVLPTTPAVPTGVAAVPANAGAVVSWTPGVGGAAASGYQVTAAPGGATCDAGSTTSCYVTGLTNGTAYTFTVRATNTAGASNASTASSAVTPVATGPAAPASLTASGNNESVTVSWATVVGASGGYSVYSLPGNYSCTQITQASTSCIVNGLTNGTAYTFRVLAKNGTEYGSAGSVAGTPATLPGAPTNATATNNSAGAIVLNWTAPANNGGSAITSYTVASNPAGATCAPGTATTCVITGATFGTVYTFTIFANNAKGQSVTGAQVEGTGAAVPTAPTITSVIPSSLGNAAVTWTAGAANGSPITGFTVVRYIGTGARTVHCTVTTGTTCSAAATIPNGAYTFKMVATNAVGVSDTSNSMNAQVTSLAAGFAQGLFGFVEGQNTFRVSSGVASSVDKVLITVTDMQGRIVWSKSAHPARDGIHSISWNAAQGFKASSGMYMVRADVTVKGEVQSLTRKTVAFQH